MYQGTARLEAVAGAGSSSYSTVTAASTADGVVKGVHELEYEPSDRWPIAVSWVLTEATGEAAHVSLFAVTVSALVSL